MISTHIIKTRVSPDTKARVSKEAQRQLLTESLWLRRVVDAALSRAQASDDEPLQITVPGSLDGRIQQGREPGRGGRTFVYPPSAR